MLDRSLKRTTLPTSEPLTLAELKAHLRIDESETADDDRLEEVLQAAREQVEADTRCSIMPQTWTLKLDCFEASTKLPNGPVTAVSSVSYLDELGASQSVDSSVYTLDAFENPAVLRLAYLQTWPTFRGDARSISIVYTAGYANAAAVPARFKQAILLKAEALYDGEAVAGSSSPIVRAYNALVAGLRTGDYP